VSFDPSGDNRILQEVYQDDPWMMLCGCILLNLTSRAQVDGVRDELFERWPAPFRMQFADEGELGELLKPLGLWRRRAKTLTRFSGDWLLYADHCSEWPLPAHIVERMYGIGKYALDSYKIFVLHEQLRPQDVDDTVLKKWLELYHVDRR